jgi:hypothetical protein
MDALGDERITKAILLFRLGIPENDDIILSDSWTCVAVKTIRSHVEQRQMEEAQRAARERR